MAATGAISLLILAGGCAKSHTDQVTTATPAAVEQTTTTTAPASTTTTAPPTTEAPTATVPEQPTTTTAPEPATITVKYQPHDGGVATATLEETGETKSLADGSAVFTGLADGTYTVDLEVVYPNSSFDSGAIGASTIQRSKPIAVQAGDHAVVACDDTGCTGIA